MALTISTDSTIYELIATINMLHDSVDKLSARITTLEDERLEYCIDIGALADEVLNKIDVPDPEEIVEMILRRISRAFQDL